MACCVALGLFITLLRWLWLRLTFRKAGPIRLEAYFTFKPEATELALSETDIRSFGFLYDLQIGDTSGPGDRVMPHLRFLNAQDGQHIQKWQFKRRTTPIKPIGTAGKTITHYHLAPEDWEDLPGGEQRLCYNEIPTKVNWHYLRFDFDLAAMADVDVIVTYGDGDVLPALQADPLWSTLPAVKAGAVVEIGKGDALSAAVSPTALSIPWVLPQYVPLLEKAAAKVQ